MARQPYFSGNYGSALAQIDTRPIMQGAAAQAAAYQSIGQNIGGAIEKYGLMKEQQKKDKGFLKGAITGIKALKEGDPNPQNDMMYDAAVAGAEDENKPLVQRVAEMKQMQQQINLTGQQNMQQSLISARDATTAATQQAMGAAAKLKEDQDFVNNRLFKEKREVENTWNSLSPEEREGATPTGRAKWLMALDESVLERGALPIKNATFDPEAARYRDLQMGLSEFKFKQAEGAESAFPTSERAGLERDKAKTDIRYKEGMMSANLMNALKGSNPKAGDKAEDIQTKRTKLESGTIGHGIPGLNGIKLSEYLGHDLRDDDRLDDRSKKIIRQHTALGDEHSLLLETEMTNVKKVNKETGEVTFELMSLANLMNIEQEEKKLAEEKRRRQQGEWNEQLSGATRSRSM